MTTVTLELPDDVAKQLQQLDLETLIPLLKRTLAFIPHHYLTQGHDEGTFLAAPDSKLPPITTLADLLLYGYGAWADRDDITDAVIYAASLRKQAWQRPQ